MDYRQLLLMTEKKESVSNSEIISQIRHCDWTLIKYTSVTAHLSSLFGFYELKQMKQSYEKDIDLILVNHVILCDRLER